MRRNISGNLGLCKYLGPGSVQQMILSFFNLVVLDTMVCPGCWSEIVEKLDYPKDYDY